MAGVTADEVCKYFLRARGAQKYYASWTRNPTLGDVVPRVMAHTSRVLIEIPFETIDRVGRSTAHALGEIDKLEIETIPDIADWTTPFAVTHVFGFIVEQFGSMPTWEEFRDASRAKAFRSMLWEPAQREVSRVVAKYDVDPKLAHDAMQWRIGNFYYSFLREQYIFSRFRFRGVPVKQHPLADALFRVDGWVGNLNINLYVGNPKYRDRHLGRKHQAQEILKSAVPPFCWEDIALTPATKFGRVHVPTLADIDAYAERIKKRIEQGECGPLDGYSD